MERSMTNTSEGAPPLPPTANLQPQAMRSVGGDIQGANGRVHGYSSVGTRAGSSNNLSVPSRADQQLRAGGGNSGSQQVPESPSISSNSPSPPRVCRRDGKKFVGCSAFEDYELTTKVGEGTFGEVHKAVHKATGAVVALKRVLMHNEKEGLPITAIREIKLLKSLRHPNIVPLTDMLVKHESRGSGQNPSVYMVFPYMEHDLTGLLENPKVHLRIEHIKLYLRQLLEGTAYLHASNVMHRDMKASNLLVTNSGMLYIADFGLARAFNPDEKKDMTKCVVTRWYRPPELLMGERRYTTAIDMWGVGCIFAEMLLGRPVFQGKTDLDQLEQIFRVCGTPDISSWPKWKSLPDCSNVGEFMRYSRRIREEFHRYGDDVVDLLDQLLQLDPERRPDAATALKHNVFCSAPLPARPEDMPKFEHSHEFDRRKHQQRPHQGSQQQQQQQQQQRHSAQHHPHNSPSRRRDSFHNYHGRNYRNDESYNRPMPQRNYDGYRESRRNGGGSGARGNVSRGGGYHPYQRGYNNSDNVGGWK